MYNNWDYPEGADCEYAPWNTKEEDEEEVDVEEEKQAWNELYNDEK